MGRPSKLGHDYFPFYTARKDRKSLTKIQSNLGNDGYVVVLETDCMIRGNYDNGYYIDWSEDVASDLFEICGKVDTKMIKKILEFAVESGYYDKKLYINYHILTNKSIQLDHIFNSQRRDNFHIKKEYMLVDENDLFEAGIKRKIVLENGFFQWFNANNNLVNVGNNSINANDNAQIKINKIKEKNIKENKIKENGNGIGIGNGIGKGITESASQVFPSNVHKTIISLVNSGYIDGNDPVDIEQLNDFMFSLQTSTEKGGYGYTPKEVNIASSELKKTLKAKTDAELAQIIDMPSYITGSIIEILKRRSKYEN